MSEPKQNREHNMFVFLWILIILGGGIWYFSAVPKAKDPLPGVYLSPELGRMFLSAETFKRSPSRYSLNLSIRQSYRGQWGGSAEVMIAYQLMGHEKALYSNVVKCILKAGDAQTELILPNPELVTARGIKLFLAH